MNAPLPILLPGNMCDERMWAEPIREALPGAAAADLTSDSSIPAMAARNLSEHAGPLLAVGFSMGAIVALEMYRQAPGRIAAAVLIGLNAGADLPDRAARRPLQQAKVRRGGLERVLVEELKPNYLAASHRGDRVLLDLLRDMGMKLGSDVFIRQSEALRTRADLTATLTAFAAPLALMCGEEDALCPPGWHRKWQSLSGNASLTIVPGAGHMLPLEASQAVATSVRALVREIT